MYSNHLLTRRNLLGYSFLAAGLGLGLPRLGFAVGDPGLGGGLFSSRRCVVVIDQVGGNDGFNTIVPYANPDYARCRPTLGVAASSVLPLAEGLGLHASLRPLMSTWDAGELAILQGVGVEGGGCHEAARAAWRGSDRGGLNSGLGSDAAVCVTFGAGAGPLSGPGLTPISLGGASHVEDFAITSEQAHDSIIVAIRARIAATSVTGAFPSSVLGRDLEQAARMIAGGMMPAAIIVSHDGYDTHADQRATHDRLLDDLGQSLAAFRSAMMSANRWQDVLVMTASEFGRHPHENANGGTEHGTASTHMMMGGRVRGGTFGMAPSLSDPSAHPTALVHALYGHLIREHRQNGDRLTSMVDPRAAFASGRC
jgi:uncharacterized protein (DUF1501 family)